MDTHPCLQVAHRTPGRVRFRLPWLKRSPEEATPIADRVAAVSGVREVNVHPRTGSVLVEYDPERVGEPAVVEAVRAASGTERVFTREESETSALWHSIERELAHDGRALARETLRFFRGVNEDIVLASGGSFDLATASALGFLTLGVGEVVTSGKMPMPQWFQLYWWAFRTFTSFERDAESVAAATAAVTTH